MTFSTPSQHNSNFELRGVGDCKQHGALKGSHLKVTKRNRNKDIQTTEKLSLSIQQQNQSAEASMIATNTIKVQKNHVTGHIETMHTLLAKDLDEDIQMGLDVEAL